MLARVGSANDEDIHVILVGLIENLAGEWWIGKRSGERKSGVRCYMGMGVGGDFGYALRRKVFCGQRGFELGGRGGRGGDFTDCGKN